MMNSTNAKIANFIFMSRWLQAPLYFGLMVILCVYVYEFGIGLLHLVTSVNQLTETGIMLLALDLIDMVMIANLLIMVILGGYETFVSRLDLGDHPDQPEWLDHVNAGTMKIKLALAIVTISSIHLLRTFIDPSQRDLEVVKWQVIIHLALVVSAIFVAFTDRIMSSTIHKK